MCEFLDTFDLGSVDEDTLSKMISSVSNFLSRAQEHYTNVVAELSFKSASASSPKAASLSYDVSTPQFNLDTSHPILNNTEYHQQALDLPTLSKLKNELQHTEYQKSGDNKAPEVCLYGNIPYTYNRATKNLLPHPLSSSPTIARVLKIVNNHYGGNFNSVLINKYKNKNVILGWHKDDEDVVDNSHPILSLSVGATRRFSLSDSKDKNGRHHHYTTHLRDNDVFIMKAGVQNKFYHRVEQGRDSAPGERGIRYSLTFRCIRPATYTPDISTSDHSGCVSTMVFGSSLTKGLKEDLLSQGGEKVKVFSHPGACIKEVRKDIDNVLSDKDVCLQCVKSIFLVVGGNQVENARSPERFQIFLNEYNDLLGYLSKVLPQTHINVISLLPRRAKDSFHNVKMLRANEKLSEMCEQSHNCRFINIFSHFLVHKKQFFINRVINLNEKLFVIDMLHFSKLGNSVLGKVIKGVIYKPRK